MKSKYQIPLWVFTVVIVLIRFTDCREVPIDEKILYHVLEGQEEIVTLVHQNRKNINHLFEVSAKLITESKQLEHLIPDANDPNKEN